MGLRPSIPLGFTTSGPEAAISASGFAAPNPPMGSPPSEDEGGAGALDRFGLTSKRMNMPMTRRKSRKRIFRFVYLR